MKLRKAITFLISFSLSIVFAVSFPLQTTALSASVGKSASPVIEKNVGVVSGIAKKAYLFDEVSEVNRKSFLFEREYKSRKYGQHPSFQQKGYKFNNPAGCSEIAPNNLTSAEMLANVQSQLGDSLNLSERRITRIWNEAQGTMLEVADDAFVYEFAVNEFQPPFTYKGDQAMTIFLQNGFAVWFRSYGGVFRLTAVPMIEGVEDSIWAEYVTAYWEKDGFLDEEMIVRVSKKLPCHWMIDEGYVKNEQVEELFDLDWHIPDYLNAGRKYLAETCAEAHRISNEEIGWWDATSMCGPLTWQINHDANSFPYRIGSYDADASLFINANPRYWYGRPWNGFDPETFDLVVETDEKMAGYDFGNKGNLHTGDILFSYGTSGKWTTSDGRFSHIFMVAGIDENNSRIAITNMVKNLYGVKDCFIREVVLYTPGDLTTGVINYEWDNHGYGFTGRHGFDVFRWKWISYHIEGHSREYTVRWGETLETIGFDWKVSPEDIAAFSNIDINMQLVPGQSITLPTPDMIE